MRDVVIVDSVRTGLAKSFRGSFNLTRPDDQVAHCIDALLKRNEKINPSEVEDVIVGAASQIGEQGGNLARLAVILSNLPTSTAGTTISRACSSGLNSIAMAATQIASGYSEMMIAGGVESISAGQRQTPGKSDSHPFILEKSPDIFMAMGNTAEVVARRYNVTREAQDEFALLSQAVLQIISQLWLKLITRATRSFLLEFLLTQTTLTTRVSKNYPNKK